MRFDKNCYNKNHTDAPDYEKTKILKFTETIYGAADTVGSFTLNEWATLSSDATTNRVQANKITVDGTVDIASGGTLELAATDGVYFNGILSIGLGCR